MPEAKSTYLRYIRSKDPDKLTKMVSSLDHRVQVYDIVLGPENTWYVWLVHSDNNMPKIPNGKLD